MHSQLGQRRVDDGGEQVELVAVQASVVQLQRSIQTSVVVMDHCSSMVD